LSKGVPLLLSKSGRARGWALIVERHSFSGRNTLRASHSASHAALGLGAVSARFRPCEADPATTDSPAARLPG